MIRDAVPTTECERFHSILRIYHKCTALAEVGKFGAVAGTIGTVVGVFFNYDTHLPLSLAAISGITWICCGKIAQDFESQAQTIMESFKESQKRKKHVSNHSFHLLPPLLLKPAKSLSLHTSTLEIMRGRLWPLIGKVLSEGNNQYKPLGAFQVFKLGKIVISTDSTQDEAVLKYPRYCENVKGGHGWDTFACICFGWENLIMAKGEKHQKLLKALSPLFKKQVVRERYFENLKTVTEMTVLEWEKKKEGIDLLNGAMQHSCRSVSSCFLGKEAGNSKEIVEAVQNLMHIFWDLSQFKPKAVIHQMSRQIFKRPAGDLIGYWHSHDILEKAIEQARTLVRASHAENEVDNFMSRLLDHRLTAQEIIDNMKMLYFAGTETTGSLMTTALGCLAANEKEQDNLMVEFREANVKSIEDLNDEKLRTLKRLEAIIYESLRLVPPIPAQVRKIKTDFGSYAYFIDHFHRLRDRTLVGDNPEKFEPERILENPLLKKEIDKTFGSGLTPCLGKYFALTETSLLIAAVILQGHIEIVEGDPSSIIIEAGAHLPLNVKIRFKPIGL